MKNLKDYLQKKIGCDYEPYQGLILPKKEKRLNNDNFKINENYINFTIKNINFIQNYISINPALNLLDLGCGNGRLAIGLRYMYLKCNYIGIDVSNHRIKWNNKYLSDENTKFIHINASNDRYNPNGTKLISNFLPKIDVSIDLIFCYSLFSHLEEEDAFTYLIFFKDVLKINGLVIFTGFFEEGVENISINPENYLKMEFKGPLHCVRYNKEYFENKLKDIGFEIMDFKYRQAEDFQSFYVLKFLKQ